MIITISDMWKNQQKMLDNDNQIKLSSLIVILAAKYNMATLEERTRFKLRCEVLMLEIKDRNHKGKQGALSLFLLSPGRAQARALSLSSLSSPSPLCPV